MTTHRRRCRGLTGLLGLAALLACAETTVEGARPLLVTLSAAPRTARAGDAISVNVEAQGSSLFGVILDYGDERADSVAANGARTLGVTRQHAYTRAGRFRVLARAIEGTTGQTASDSLFVDITAAAGR